MPATPTVAENKSRILKKVISCLVNVSNEADKPVGHGTIQKALGRIWICSDVPSGGTGVATGDICLDYTNDDVYRYGAAAWYKISVES